MSDWAPYAGEGLPHEWDLPPAPPWRRFDTAHEQERTFQAAPEVVDAVNVALVLRRPLLVTGRPGSGKSSLIDDVALELGIGPVLRWHVTSRSTLQDALYRYDAIARLQAHTLEGDAPEIGRFLRLGPLGTALLPAKWPRALLIDEIDKSDIDLPNDLLNVFERGEYEIPELARLNEETVKIREHGSDTTAAITRGRVRATEFPFVVLTNNGERDFPPAFLRRCVRLRMPAPTAERLARIVAAHLGDEAAARVEEMIEQFAAQLQSGDGAHATDQLINAVFLGAGLGEHERRDAIVHMILKELNADLR